MRRSLAALVALAAACSDSGDVVAPDAPADAPGVVPDAPPAPPDALACGDACVAAGGACETATDTCVFDCSAYTACATQVVCPPGVPCRVGFCHFSCPGGIEWTMGASCACWGCGACLPGDACGGTEGWVRCGQSACAGPVASQASAMTTIACTG